MHWIFDIFLVLIFALILVIDTKRGFVKAVWGFARAAASLVLSLMFGGALGMLFYKIFMLDAVTNTVYSTLEPIIGLTNGSYNISAVFEGHEGFSELLARFGVSAESLEATFGGFTNATQDTVREMARTIAAPIADTLSTVLGFVVIFVVAMIALFIVGKVVDLLAKLPVIKTLNSFLGAVFGAASGFIYVWIICLVFSMIIEYRAAGQTTDSLVLMVKDSYIFNFFCKFSPFDFIHIGL